MCNKTFMKQLHDIYVRTYIGDDSKYQAYITSDEKSLKCHIKQY